MSNTAYRTEHIEREGFRFRVEYFYDDDSTPPWEDDCGTGIVSDWTRRDKKPGEVVLCEDRGSKRFYDWQRTMGKAKKEGWGLSEKARVELVAKLGREPKPGEVRHAAVQMDFDILRDWCRNEWWYCGIVLTYCPDDEDEPDTDYGYALWRVEDGYDSKWSDYHPEVIDNLLIDALHPLVEARDKAAAALAWVEQEYTSW